jgi:hypothetical protein
VTIPIITLRIAPVIYRETAECSQPTSNRAGQQKTFEEMSTLVMIELPTTTRLLAMS